MLKPISKNIIICACIAYLITIMVTPIQAKHVFFDEPIQKSVQKQSRIIKENDKRRTFFKRSKSKVSTFFNQLKKEAKALKKESLFGTLALWLLLAAFVIGIISAWITFLQVIAFIAATGSLVLSIIGLFKDEKVTKAAIVFGIFLLPMLASLVFLLA